MVQARLQKVWVYLAALRISSLADCAQVFDDSTLPLHHFRLVNFDVFHFNGARFMLGLFLMQRQRAFNTLYALLYRLDLLDR